MPEYGEVVVTGIVEYAGLYVTITLDGVVVQTAQLSLCIVIILDVHTHLFVVAFQCSEYVDRQGAADIAGYGGVLAQRAVAHLAQYIYQGVKPRYLARGALQIVFKGNNRLLERMIHLCSFMTGVGQVKYISRLLRV